MAKGPRGDWGRVWGAVGLDGEVRAGQEGTGLLATLRRASKRVALGHRPVTVAPRRQWLADALKENDPSNVILFLVGSKKDLSVSVPPFPRAPCAPARQGCPHHPPTTPGSVGRRRHSTA